MSKLRIEIAEESTPRKSFVWALGWPGWCRSGRNPVLALQALVEAAGRYAPVAREAGLEFPDITDAKFVTVATAEGGAGTEFGVPSVIIDDDRRSVDAAAAARLAALVAASWAAFDRVAARAPEILRKGPRGGGRDTSKIVTHVDEADGAYAREMGIKLKPTGDRAGVDALRTLMLEILGQPSDGSPLAGRKWPQRYAARRIAWHALDHAWEIQDKSS